jgi:esterase/lipase superfamily enzyme
MIREYHHWLSPALDRDMELLVFGHGGARVLAFPADRGRFHDWEDRGLVGALDDELESGTLQLFCVDSIDGESWYATSKPATERLRRHVAYDRYLHEEVVPFSLRHNETPVLLVTGPGLGGYHALNFTFRHPESVRRVLSLSGVADVRPLLGDYYDSECYFNNPCDFLAGEHEAERLEALRRPDIILAVGRDDPLCAANERLSRILWGKNVWHALRIWEGLAHDWPVWARMLQLYIRGHD